jgi:hypothetical protein
MNKKSKRAKVREIMLYDSAQESRNLKADAIIECQFFGRTFTARERVLGLAQVDEILKKHAQISGGR